MSEFTVVYQDYNMRTQDWDEPEILYMDHPSAADVFAWADEKAVKLVAVFEGRQDNLVED